MTLQEHALKYEDSSVCSLEELRQILKNRNIPFRFTHAQSHTKTFYKRDKEERRKTTALLRKADAAATIPFRELAAELRDEIYDYYLEGTTRNEAITEDEFRNRLRCVSLRFGGEAGAVLERGANQVLPRRADMSSTLAETSLARGTLFMTPARQTLRPVMSLPSSLVRFKGLVMMGPAGQGKIFGCSTLHSLRTLPSPEFDTVESWSLQNLSSSTQSYIENELSVLGKMRYQSALCTLITMLSANGPIGYSQFLPIADVACQTPPEVQALKLWKKSFNVASTR